MAFDRYRYRYGFGDGGFPAHVPVAAQRARALLEARKLEKKGRTLDPVTVGHRAVIAKTFWGKAWCTNLESYSDYSNRLPRGRTYCRSGSVLDLRIGKGRIDALVRGSSLYEIAVEIAPLSPARQRALVAQCQGRIDSVVELLSGRVPAEVLEAIADPRSGVFPAPKQIELNCSCPDSALLCKHLAAVLYGVGARLDERPELFFTLRSIDAEKLAATGTRRAGTSAAGRGRKKPAIAKAALEGIFGIELDRGRRRRP